VNSRNCHFLKVREFLALRILYSEACLSTELGLNGCMYFVKILGDVYSEG
jgi:hypothetical protein